MKYRYQRIKKCKGITDRIEQLSDEESGHKLIDGEERGRAEQSFEKLEKLLNRGLQIYSSIDSPQETKALFTPLEMKYISIADEIKKLTDKTDERFEKLLYEVGIFLAGSFTDDKLNKALACVSIAYGYADDELIRALDTLKVDLLSFHEKTIGSEGSYPDVSQSLEEVAKIINKLISEV